MAAVTTGVIGIAAAGYQVYNAQQQKKKAQNELNDYERQELNNAFENVKISTMGSDLLREENARTSGSLVDATRMGGARTVIGGIPKIVAGTNEVNQQAAKMLDDQVQQREYAIAGDNARIEGITENRDNANISALSSQIDSANQDFWNGINSGITSANYLMKGVEGIKSNNKNNSKTPVDTVTDKVSGVQIQKQEIPIPQLKINSPYSNIETANPYMFDDGNTDLINKYGRSTKNSMF